MLLLVLGWGRAPGHWAGSSAGPQPFLGLPSAELPPLASPSPHPPPCLHQPHCICHQPALLPSLGQTLFGGDWQAAHVHGGGGNTHCGRQGFTAIWFPTFPAALLPLWPLAPKGSEPRITRPGPALPILTPPTAYSKFPSKGRARQAKIIPKPLLSTMRWASLKDATSLGILIPYNPER